jgi:hypothetical protein
MLSDLERDRLNGRGTLDKKTRAVNDARVKKKLISWLGDAVDALAILRNIPSERLKDDLIDIDAYLLLSIAEDIMRDRRFMAVKGKLEAPSEWEAEGYGITRPANNIDIARTSMVNDHVRELTCFVGGNNPILDAKLVSRILDAPDTPDYFKDRLAFTPGEKEGVRRVFESERNYVLSVTLDRKKETSKEEHPNDGKA